jgi:ParB-like chromosome segregation protein Spo0J
MNRPLELHPVAALFPELSSEDFAALKEDIRRHGLKVPVLVHGGEILDGRHRYRACRELGIPCAVVEWNGADPWLEVQSRNLIRRHLAKDQVYAIRKLAALQFPDLAGPIEAERANAKARKAQAKGQPRGQKALSRSQGRHRESADFIGAQLGVSGSTVKRVDRLAREAPTLVPKVASGEWSVKRALREVTKTPSPETGQRSVAKGDLPIDRLMRRIELAIKAESEKWPRDDRTNLLFGLQQQLTDVIHAFSLSVQRRREPPVRTTAVKAHMRA